MVKRGQAPKQDSGKRVKHTISNKDPSPAVNVAIASDADVAELTQDVLTTCGHNVRAATSASYSSSARRYDDFCNKSDPPFEPLERAAQQLQQGSPPSGQAAALAAAGRAAQQLQQGSPPTTLAAALAAAGRGAQRLQQGSPPSGQAAALAAAGRAAQQLQQGSPTTALAAALAAARRGAQQLQQGSPPSGQAAALAAAGRAAQQLQQGSPPTALAAAGRAAQQLHQGSPTTALAAALAAAGRGALQPLSGSPTTAPCMPTTVGDVVEAFLKLPPKASTGLLQGTNVFIRLAAAFSLPKGPRGYIQLWNPLPKETKDIYTTAAANSNSLQGRVRKGTRTKGVRQPSTKQPAARSYSQQEAYL